MSSVDRQFDWIASLVNGLAPSAREARAIMLMTCYMDDSDMAMANGTAVFAGWLAPARRWADFGAAWRAEVLDYSQPSIAAFKPNSWSLGSDSQQDRLKAALQVIQRYRPIGISICFPKTIFTDIATASKAVLPSKIKQSPYYLLAYFAVLESVAILDRANKVSKEPLFTGPVNFVFDHQPGHEQYFGDSWPRMLADMSTRAPHIRSLLTKSPPQYLHDEEAVQLQAAHLLAWSERRRLENETLNAKLSVINWPKDLTVYRASGGGALASDSFMSLRGESCGEVSSQDE